MLKHMILASLTLATLALAPVPVLTGPALAQAQCTSVRCPPNDGPGSTYKCNDQLGYLRRVYEDELEVIDNPDYVSIFPICSTEPYGVFRTDGNAGALRDVIADNDAMTEALFLKNFGADDVVGVRMTGEDKVILYVSLFHKTHNN
jgi:hypothetical protein